VGTPTYRTIVDPEPVVCVVGACTPPPPRPAEPPPCNAGSRAGQPSVGRRGGPQGLDAGRGSPAPA
jgi:hypothetical protein